MLKVFLVEDESIIREGLRDNIPWQQYGFNLVGVASDGEMALPQIRKLKPDVLITDIKMPFMDGLTLSRIVVEELPDIKIIFISGYGEFEYAQQAIEIGVEKYLLKPIKKNDLIKTLVDIKEQVSEMREQSELDRRYQLDVREFEQYTRQTFFGQLTSGALTTYQIYEQAKKLNIELDAECYNLVLFIIQPTAGATVYSEPVARLHEELMQYFMRYKEFIPFRWQWTNYAVLIRGDNSEIDRLAENCVKHIEKQCNNVTEPVNWHVAVSNPVQRLSGLAECMRQGAKILSYRHILPKHNILTNEIVASGFSNSSDSTPLEELDTEKIDMSQFAEFIDNGTRDEVSEFVSKYLQALGGAVNSLLFRQFILMSIRMIATKKMKELGYSQNDFMEGLKGFGQVQNILSNDEMTHDLSTVLYRAIEFRDNRSRNQQRDIINQALSYIERNFSDENLSLNAMAKEVNLSASYFSAVFSQGMGTTFVEYLTQKRIEKAKYLLRNSDKRSGEIAYEVGYRNPRYFSFIFKKIQACTPSEYRNEENKE